MKKILLMTLVLVLTCVSAWDTNAGKPRRLSFKSWDNYEINIQKVGTDGTKFVKVWGFGKKMDDAIMNAKMNAVHACLFRGLAANPANGAGVATPPICTSPDVAEANDDYFQDFFAPGGPYLAYINLTTDGVPSGKDCLKVKGGYKVALYVQVMYDNLKKKMQADGMARSLSSGF